MTTFKQTEQIFQGFKEYTIGNMQQYRVKIENKPVYHIYHLSDGAYIHVGSVKARSAAAALRDYLES